MNNNNGSNGVVGIYRKSLLSFIAIAILALSPTFALSEGKHACDYLSKDEAAMVLGMEIGEVKSQPANPMGQSVCFFDIPSDKGVRFAQLQMFRTEWGKSAGQEWTGNSLFENNMGFLDALQEIAGIGEKAYWGGSGLKMGAGLHVLHKDAYFTVQAATGNPEIDLEKAKALAALVIKKITP